MAWLLSSNDFGNVCNVSKHSNGRDEGLHAFLQAKTGSLTPIQQAFFSQESRGSAPGAKEGVGWSHDE